MHFVSGIKMKSCCATKCLKKSANCCLYPNIRYLKWKRSQKESIAVTKITLSTTSLALGKQFHHAFVQKKSGKVLITTIIAPGAILRQTPYQRIFFDCFYLVLSMQHKTCSLILFDKRVRENKIFCQKMTFQEIQNTDWIFSVLIIVSSLAIFNMFKSNSCFSFSGSLYKNSFEANLSYANHHYIPDRNLTCGAQPFVCMPVFFFLHTRLHNLPFHVSSFPWNQHNHFISTFDFRSGGYSWFHVLTHHRHHLYALVQVMIFYKSINTNMITHLIIITSINASPLCQITLSFGVKQYLVRIFKFTSARN